MNMDPYLRVAILKRSLPENCYSKEVGHEANSTLIISPDKVAKLFLALDQNKAMGPDNIPPRLLLLKALARNAAFVSAVAELFKKCIDQCIPSIWKTAYVIPVFKTGSRQEKENHRPILLTSVICKV